MKTPSPLKIAVVGSGIAGLAAAWLLNREHEVTLYEKNDRLGGHSNTVMVAGPGIGAGSAPGALAVDTGFIVYNEVNYPNLTALFRYLGIATHASDMSFAVSTDGGVLEYAATGLAGLFAQPANLLRPRFWRMLRDLLRFYREAPAFPGSPGAGAVSLGDYLDRNNYSGAFRDDHLLPMAAAIWSTAVDDMRRHPAASFIRFFESHGLLRLKDRPEWRTVTGGCRHYVERMAQELSGRIRLNSTIRTILRDPAGVTIEEHDGGSARFDHVVLATHADQALGLLDRPGAEERRLLGAFRYERNIAILHTDAALMPRRRRAWASWNYLRERRHGTAPSSCVTYWMNRLQALDCRSDLFLTLNPIRAPRESTVLRSFLYDHPVFDTDALAAQQSLWRLQGRDRTWYCGSYFGSGFHEDALQAGLAVAEQVGGLRRPWSVPGESGRIVLAPDLVPAEEAA